MARYHHPLSGHEFEQTLGDSEGQRILVCAVHGVTESDTTWQPNNNRHVCMCVSTLPQTSLPSRLPSGTEQGSMCSTIDPWLLLTLLLTGRFALV